VDRGQPDHVLQHHLASTRQPVSFTDDNGFHYGNVWHWGSWNGDPCFSVSLEYQTEKVGCPKAPARRYLPGVQPTPEPDAGAGQRRSVRRVRRCRSKFYDDWWAPGDAAILVAPPGCRLVLDGILAADPEPVEASVAPTITDDTTNEDQVLFLLNGWSVGQYVNGSARKLRSCSQTAL
jgi:hypothetical protein